MSYILDALRRADAERQRGGVPDLHAQPAGSATAAQAGAPTEGAGLHGRGALLAMGASVAVLAGAAAWWLVGGSPSDPAPRSLPPQQVPAAVAGLPPPGAKVLQTAPGTAPATVPAASAAPAPAVVVPAMTPAAPAPPAASPLAAGPAPVVLPAVVAAPPVAAVPAAGPGQALAAPAASVAATPASDPVIRWATLPEAIRRSLPALSWSGGVYADQPAQRLVVVNGQVAREGDELAAGLRLEQIRPKSVVVRWRGQRIELPM